MRRWQACWRPRGGGERRTRLSRLLANPADDHHVRYRIATTYAQLGKAGEAVRWLRQSAETGFPCYPWFTRDTLLDPVRLDPLFHMLMVESARVGTAAGPLRACHARPSDCPPASSQVTAPVRLRDCIVPAANRGVERARRPAPATSCHLGPKTGTPHPPSRSGAGTLLAAAAGTSWTACARTSSTRSAASGRRRPSRSCGARHVSSLGIGANAASSRWSTPSCYSRCPTTEPEQLVGVFHQGQTARCR